MIIDDVRDCCQQKTWLILHFNIPECMAIYHERQVRTASTPFLKGYHVPLMKNRAAAQFDMRVDELLGLT